MSQQFTFLTIAVLVIAGAVAFALNSKQPAMDAGEEMETAGMEMMPAPMEMPEVMPEEKATSSMPTPTPTPTPKPAKPMPAAVEPGETLAPKTHRVSIKNYEFIPANLSVKAGDIVIWTNEDLASHTIEASDGSFESPLIRTGQSYSYTFANTGSTPYFCGPHPYMKASVTIN